MSVPYGGTPGACQPLMFIFFLLPQPDEALPRNSPSNKAQLKPARLPGKLGLPLLAWEMPLLGLGAAQSLLGWKEEGLMMGPLSLSPR